MVRKILFFVFITFMLGCFYTGPRSEYGLPRRKIRPLPQNTDYNLIDTNAVYMIYARYHVNSLTKDTISFEYEKNQTYPYVGYLKFYSKGKLGLFVIHKEDTLQLQRCLFNPKKAKMGYYYIEGDRIRIRISTIGDATLYVSTTKGRIYNDTIDVSNKNNVHTIYVKKKIPVELIEGWSPDW